MIFPARARVASRPFGCCLILGPWNYPVQLLLLPLIGAIAGGNCAIVKPSELTPHTSSVIAGIIRSASEPLVRALREQPEKARARLERGRVVQRLKPRQSRRRVEIVR